MGQQFGTADTGPAGGGGIVATAQGGPGLFERSGMEHEVDTAGQTRSKGVQLRHEAGQRPGAQGRGHGMSMPPAERFARTLKHFQSTDNALAIIGMDARGILGIATGQLRMQRGRTFLFKTGGQAGDDVRRYGRNFRYAVQQTLEEMAEDGTMAEISTKWFGEDITTIGK